MRRSMWATFVLLMLASSVVYAITGDEILAKVDETANAPKDSVSTLKMVLVDRSGKETERTLTVWQKGDQKRRIRFLSPADVKGVGFLALSDQQMYLYLPAFRKVRRIASHIKNESFMGTDFSYDDIAQTRYADDYTAELSDETENAYVLELVPKPDSDVEYSRLTVQVDKKTYVVRKVEYYDKQGELRKILTTRNIQQIDNYWTPREMEMYDVRKEHRTTMVFEETRYDTGLDDKLFSQRYLKR